MSPKRETKEMKSAKADAARAVDHETKRKEVLAKLDVMGKEIIDELKNGKSPHIDIPLRSLSNINFNSETNLLQLGDKKSKRSFMNTAHTRKFMQTMLVAGFCQELLEENLHTSLRDMYYAIKRNIPGTKLNTVEEQGESDPCIVDLEVAENVLREEMHLNADVRGRVVGEVVIKDRGDIVNWAKLGSGGWSIPSNVEEISFESVDADFIFVVEKNAAFERMHEDKFWKHQGCVLVTTTGQAARGVRRLVNRLSTEHKLPVIVFTDADAYGWYIYSVIKRGSMNLAHVSTRLGTSDAKYVGLTMSDIEDYDLKGYTIKAKDVDLKRTRELANYPWFQKPEWQHEIKLMLDKGYKAELEALSSRGLKFMTTKYLPEKIEGKKFLP